MKYIDYSKIFTNVFGLSSTYDQLPKNLLVKLSSAMWLVKRTGAFLLSNWTPLSTISMQVTSDFA